MAVKQLNIPNVGDDVLYHMAGAIRPAKVVTGGDSETTYIGLSVQTASDGSPGALDKCAPIFYTYCPHGEGEGHWQWKEELNMKQIVVGVNELGQVTKPEAVPVVHVEPPIVSPYVEETPKLPVGVGGVLSPESDLGKVIASELLTIRSAASKLQSFVKVRPEQAPRIVISGTEADKEQFNTMLAAIAVSCENTRATLFGL